MTYHDCRLIYDVFFSDHLHFCVVMLDRFYFVFLSNSFFVVVTITEHPFKVFPRQYTLTSVSFSTSFYKFLYNPFFTGLNCFHLWMYKFVELWRVYLHISFGVVLCIISITTFGHYFFF